MAETRPTHDEVWADLGKRRVQFWVCIREDHNQVEWRGDVAHCLTPPGGRPLRLPRRPREEPSP